MADIIVIGGGAAGVLAAIRAAGKGADVVLLEKNGSIGHKLLLTGKGRCNITNAKGWSEFSRHLHPKPNFFRPAFYNFPNTATVEFFENECGVETVLTRGDRVFPKTMMSKTVVNGLRRCLQDKGVKMEYNCDVMKVEKTGDGGFAVTVVNAQQRQMSGKVFTAKAVIVATGGLSYPVTGSTGRGYEIAGSFGHEIMECFPSLTALTPQNYDMRLEGLDLVNVSAMLYIDRNIVADEFGDISFTDGGIEGPIGFKISRKAVKALRNGNRVEVVLDLKPAVALDVLSARVAKEAAALPVSKHPDRQNMKALLRKFMPAQMIDPFMDSNKDLKVENLAHKLKEWRFKIADYVGYRRAVVTAGGVSTEEINSKTMGSKFVPGLYFAGEVLDVDGDTGGYNLQVAFSTGVLAADSAVKYLGGADSKE